MTPLIFVCLLLQQPVQQNDFSRAVAMYQQGLYFESEEAFRRHLARDPSNGQANMGLAMCLVFTSRTEESLTWFEKAEGCKPVEAQFFANHGSALETLGRLDEARAKFNRALELDPKFVAALFSLGQMNSRQGNYADAAVFLKKVLEINPRHLEAAYELAEVQFREKNYADAEKSAKAIADANPRHFQSRYLLSRIYMKTNRQELAARVADEAQKLQDIDERRRLTEKKVSSLLGLAFKALRASQISPAIGYFEEILRLDRANVQARGTLTRLMEDLRKRNQSAAADQIAVILAR